MTFTKTIKNQVVMDNKLDPEVKKAIWKIVVYAVSVFAALFAGNAAAKAGYKFIQKPLDQVAYVYTKSEIV